MNKCFMVFALLLSIRATANFVNTKPGLMTTVLFQEKTQQDSIAQSTLRGKVVDEKGEPIYSAFAGILRTRKGTVTDANGYFKLNGINRKDSLIVSCLKFNPLTITEIKADTLSIILKREHPLIDVIIIKEHKRKKMK